MKHRMSKENTGHDKKTEKQNRTSEFVCMYVFVDIRRCLFHLCACPNMLRPVGSGSPLAGIQWPEEGDRNDNPNERAAIRQLDDGCLTVEEDFISWHRRALQREADCDNIVKNENDKYIVASPSVMLPMKKKARHVYPSK